MGRFLLLVSLVVLGTGCSLISEKVNLRPSSVIIDHQNIGRGTQVVLLVEDKRATTVIGYRNPMLHSGEITLKGDIVKIFEDQMKQILESKGFVVVNDQTTSRKCVVSIKDLSYSLIPGLFDVVGECRVVIDMETGNIVSKKNYFKNYYTTDQDHELAAPTQDRNEELINQALGKVFNQISLDSQLYQSLI